MDEHSRKIIVRIAGSMGPVASAATIPRLLAALWSDSLDGAGIARLVSTEPNLTMRILRVANSAYYGMSGTVSSVKRAVLVLGQDAVRGIAAAGCLGRALPSGADPAQGAQLLRHSIATAVGAQALADAVRLEQRGDAFISGLLHDIGAAVIASLEAPTETADRSVLETWSHAEIGGVLIQAWNLPPWLSSLTAHHDDPLAAPADLRRLACIVSLADEMAQRLGMGYATDAHAHRTQEYAEAARVPPNALERAAAEVPVRTSEMFRALARP